MHNKKKTQKKTRNTRNVFHGKRKKIFTPQFFRNKQYNILKLKKYIYTV